VTLSPDELFRGTENPQGYDICALADDLYCAPSGTCVRANALGEPCNDIYDCTLGTYCSGGACLPILAIGDACSSPDTSACGFGNYCNEPGRCAPKKPIGAACESDSECTNHNCTPFGVCAPPGQQTVCEHFSDIEIED
jgi:hypothetical protein